MRLSCYESSPDYHEVVYFIDRVTVNGKIVNNCIAFDTEARTITRMRVNEDGMFTTVAGEIETEIIKGDVRFTWLHVPERDSHVFLALKSDWESRK